jgi:hypothetical protein
MTEATAILLGKYLLVRPVEILVVLTSLALVFRIPIRNGWAWTVTGAGLACFFLWPVLEPPTGTDVHYLWVNGCDIWNGIDPYHNLPCPNPPTAFPLFALLAVFPFQLTLLLWTVSLLVGTCTLVVLAQRVLARGKSESWLLPPPALGVLTAALALSVASRYGMGVAQLSMLITLVLLLALWARNRGRPGQAGLWLAVGTWKVQTMLPFLLLFGRRQDRRAWLSLGAGCLGLYLLANPPLELFGRLRECLDNIATLASPGQMNDYAQDVCFDVIGFHRALHFLGIHDRGVVQATALALLLALGGWVAWRCFGPRAWAPAPACCLVTLYATLFLYHRLYDMLLLALPLVYTVGRARTAEGRARWWYSAVACSLLGVLYLRLETLKALSAPGTAGAAPEWLKALIVPYGLYLILVALVCLEVAEKYVGRAIPLGRSDGVLPLAEAACPTECISPVVEPEPEAERVHASAA